MNVIPGDSELESSTENMTERACVFDVDTRAFQFSPAGVNRLITDTVPQQQQQKKQVSSRGENEACLS